MNTNNGNGTNGNSNGTNGNGKHSNNANRLSPRQAITSIQQLEELSSQTSEIKPKPPPTTPRYVPKFDQAVILKQSRFWSRAILWELMGVTAGTIIWANIAKIEEAVSATGKLEPTGTVKEIQAPVDGVVKEIFVEDGKQVKKGERLLTLDNTTAKAQLDSLHKIRASLAQENQFYKSQLRASNEVDFTSLRISLEILDLTKSRAALLAENQVFRAQLDGNSSSNLIQEQRERIFSNQVELDARLAAA